MNTGETVTIRYLPEGSSQSAVVHRIEGRILELQLGDLEKRVEPEPPLGTLLEIVEAASIYLGVIQRVTSGGSTNQGGLTVFIEHYLDRKAVAELQVIWSQVEPST